MFHSFSIQKGKVYIPKNHNAKNPLLSAYKIALILPQNDFLGILGKIKPILYTDSIINGIFAQ